MKKIACVGYHETGAGVIDNIFRECDNVCQGKYEAEVRFLHDPDGISDLEYHLVNNPHRLSSTLAIKRFIRYAKTQNRQVKKIFGDSWMELATAYAENLALCKYRGYTLGDICMLNSVQRIELYTKKAFNRLKPPKYRFPVWHNYLPWLDTYYSRLSEDVFLSITKQFVEELCIRLNTGNKEFVMLDQFIEASNPSRYLRYVDNLKVIIVDRDPRDLFIHHLIRGDKVLPYEPEKFCVVYKGIRQLSVEDPKDQVLRLKFEDLIYKYKDSLNSVFNFVGMLPQHHISPKSHFDPESSAKGTKLWKVYPQYENAIKIIENRLPEYLYQY